ncbi:MAG TPA: SDR family NAD(P)-dependent oxidoreductase [Thermoanaerobaculia bacterium]|nr:SDR family NAD(P)-dependent oxidoreductase [Thermoanaerobaculia bacterium]
MTVPKDPRSPIAVVGISALFPGSLDATGFWQDILQGTDRMTDVPPSHWLIEDYYDPNPAAPDKTYARRGAFLGDVPFDAMGWGVPPNILPATDTAQLLALIVANKVLEDACAGGRQLDRSRTSVILGVTSGQELLGSMVSRLQRPVWHRSLLEAGIPESEAAAICERIAAHYPEWNESTFPGLLGNVVAGRIANRLALGGTNCVTDAACASSFSALQMGIQELVLGDSDVVITGGVDAMNDIFMFLCFSKTPALSPTGDCRPFSDRADGTMLGEGLAMVALKRLADAERDGDRIYAVVQGVGSSSDGRSKSVYAPVPEGQARALRRAYGRAGYGPETVELMEAHGTGTKAGDAAEFEGLRMVFDESGQTDRQWCALGSVKSQIGHTKAAAGAAGLFKAVMALHHKVLPPTIKVDRPNPKLELERSPFHLATRSRPWVRGSSHPRRASVSSFGFGGSNFHVALSEYEGAPSSTTRMGDAIGAAGRVAPRLRSLGAELVLLSGRSGEEIAEQARRHAESASRPGHLAWLSRTSQRCFDPTAAARLAVVAGESDLAEKLLDAARRISEHPGTDFETPSNVLYTASSQSANEATGTLAFLFAGQGSQYVDMGADLAMHFDRARAIWDDAADLSWSRDGAPEPGLHQVVFPPTAFTPVDRQAQTERISATEWAQPAIGATSLSMLSLLDRLGLCADCFAGHSFGELTALCASGALSRLDFLAAARRRGEAMRDAARVPGAMTAVSASLERVRELLDTQPSEVVIANHNHPEQVVLSGPVAAIEEIELRLEAQRIATKRLPVATAFHSPLVAPASLAFGEYLSTLELSATRKPVYSNTTAGASPSSPDALRAQLADQLAQPVRYVEMIEAMYADGVRTFVEVGPGSIQTGLVRTILGARPHLAVSIDRKGQPGWPALLKASAALACAGRKLDYDALWEGYAEPVDPAERSEPKLMVEINGANYGKPYPPRGDQSKSVAPTSAASLPRAAATTAATRPAAPVAAPAPLAAPALGAGAPSQHARTATSAPAPATPAPAPAMALEAPLAAPMAARTAPAVSTVPAISSVVASQSWAQAIQEIQRQTADAHSLFLQTMTASHTAFLDTMERGLRFGLGLDSAAATLPVLATSQTSPTAAAPPAAERVVTVPVAAPAAPAASMAPTQTSVASPAPVAAAPRPEPSPAVATTATATEAAAPAIDLHALMLQVVSEKTGYPTEMLQLDMELEGDLGIDSIKRVEILSEMTDRAPGLPALETSELAALVTLGQVVAYLDAKLEGSGSAPAALASEAPETAAATAPTPTAAQPAIDLHALMLQVVSEKTGYPAEMLQLEMELEGDLGIDSIKRVEILSEMTDRAPGLPVLETSELAALSTLGQVVAYLDAKLSGSGQPVAIEPTPVAAASPIEASDEGPTTTPAGAEIGRYAVVAVERASAGLAIHGLYGDGPVLVTPDGGDLQSALVAELQDRGIDAVAADARLLETLLADPAPAGIRGVVFLGGLREVPSTEAATAVNREAFQIARAAATTLAGADAGLFVTVQDTGGTFGFESAPAPDRAWLAGCAGLARSAGVEWPRIGVKAIDLERGARSSDSLARAIAAELEQGGADIDVGLTADGRRLVLDTRESPTEGAKTILRDGDVVLASGGARGVTAATMVALASVAKLRFVLLGRTPLDEEPEACRGIAGDAELKRVLLARSREAGLALTPAELSRQVADVSGGREIRATLEAIRAAGADARYVSADVTDPDALRDTLTVVRAEWGPVTVLVHGAGVLADKLLVDKSLEQFDRVFETKVEGLRALLAATEQDPLRAICLFSSVAARTGNAGQSDYAMANEVLNKVALAEAERRRGACLVRSLGWGPWEGGMVTPQLRARFETLGVPLIPLPLGARMLLAELADTASSTVEVVLGGDPKRQVLGSTPSETLTALRTLRMEVAVGPDSHGFLGDHAIGGTPVVPLALALEWLVRAARAAVPDRVVAGLRDIEVVRGIQLPELGGAPRRLVLEVGIRSQPAETLELAIVSPDGQLHYRCRAVLATERPLPTGLRGPEGLEPWAGRPIYDDSVLFHGPAFQVVERVRGVSEDGIEVELRGVRRARWADHGWRTDPAAVDGGLQAALLWHDHAIGGPSLPTRIAEVRLVADGPATGRVLCRVTARKTGSMRGECDVAFFDEEGNCLTELLGLQTHARFPKPALLAT